MCWLSCRSWATSAVAASRPDLVRRLVLEDVGLIRPRPPVPPVRPEGVLPFDWRLVEQLRPEIDNPDPGWPEVVAAITAPTLVVAGGATSTVPQEHVADLARILRDGSLVTIEAGHLVHAGQPAAFLRAVSTFLDVEAAAAGHASREDSTQNSLPSGSARTVQVAESS
jgi:esterase